MLEIVRNRPADSILRHKSLCRIHTIIMEGSNTYGTTWELSAWIKTSIREVIFGRFLVILSFCSGHLWREKEWCEGVSVFGSPRIVDWCFKKEKRWLCSYPKSPVLQNIANHERLRAARSSSKLVIQGLIIDRFGRKRARYWPADSILRPTTLSWIHTMRIERLITYGTPWKPPGWIKTSILGAIFGRFFSHFKTLFRAFWREKEWCEGVSVF